MDNKEYYFLHFGGGKKSIAPPSFVSLAAGCISSQNPVAILVLSASLTIPLSEDNCFLYRFIERRKSQEMVTVDYFADDF